MAPRDRAEGSDPTAVQPVMGWTDSHLHQFKVGDLRFGEPDDDSAPGPIDHSRVTLSQILPDTGSTCVYEYDFGASWEHLIEVEEELPVETVTGPLPRCVAGERACPPEDCGGPPGYADLLEAIRDPGHAEHAQYLEWVGPRFDPETFSLVAVNLGLSRWARPKSRPGGPPLRRGASPKRRI